MKKKEALQTISLLLILAYFCYKGGTVAQGDAVLAGFFAILFVFYIFLTACIDDDVVFYGQAGFLVLLILLIWVEENRWADELGGFTPV